jgi:hypothetical protein
MPTNNPGTGSKKHSRANDYGYIYYNNKWPFELSETTIGFCNFQN